MRTLRFGRRMRKATTDQELLDAVTKIPGFAGKGYTRKNFALFLFRETTEVASPGGEGPMRAYAVRGGQMRNEGLLMGQQTLDYNVQWDKARLFPRLWNAQYFGKVVWQQMREAERRPANIAITSMRCAYDKVGWKVSFSKEPPVGFDTWRVYARYKRQRG